MERANRSKRVEWVERWRDVIAAEPELPGVWRRQEGGYHVRGRTIDPRSGKMREINWALPNLSKARDAFAWLQGELEQIRSGVVAEQPSLSPQFHAYAADVFKRKLDLGKIRSVAGRSKWSNIVESTWFPRDEVKYALAKHLEAITRLRRRPIAGRAIEPLRGKYEIPEKHALWLAHVMIDVA